MRKMVFYEKWISLMMMCVTMVSYSVLINGQEKGTITPSRGIRQGDPISPYLFLLCVEGLSAMFREEECEGRIWGISVCLRGPQISHLMFVNDCIIFYNATVEEGARVLQILEYEKNSVQKLNKDKTSLFFSKNTGNETREAIKGMFGAQIIQQHERYLGLPPLIGIGKRKAFNIIKDQVGRRIAGWKEKLLSSTGWEILIKATAQATPTYTMSCFWLPNSFCKELNSMVSGVRWVKEIEKKIWCGLPGKNCALQKQTGEWDLRTSRPLILLCQLSKAAEFSQTPTLSTIKSSKKNILPKATLWKLSLDTFRRTPGGV